MRFEYRLINPRGIVSEKRSKSLRPHEGDEVLILEGLNELGKEGWDLIPWGGEFLGKKTNA